MASWQHTRRAACDTEVTDGSPATSRSQPRVEGDPLCNAETLNVSIHLTFIIHNCDGSRHAYLTRITSGAGELQVLTLLHSSTVTQF